MMKKLLGKILNRKVITALIILVQMAWGVSLIYNTAIIFPVLNSFFYVAGFCVVIYIINKENHPSYKIAWIVPIMIFPLFGVLIYLLYANKRPGRYLRKRFEKTEELVTENLKQDDSVAELMPARDATRARYLCDRGYPVCAGTQARYFASGEEMFPYMLAELEKAEHFIFLEYFIIEEGEVWSAILEILKRKAASGVDVRVIYDDMGCVGKLPTGYNFKLESMGIKCTAFNPFVPFISVVMNNRDHRKILVVDGHTSFTGGINLADEYMNIKSPYGYWKDTAVMLHGKATWSLTYMFLQMWNVLRGTKEDFDIYRPERYHTERFEGDGFVQPFSDNPLDDEAISQNVYVDIISQAEKYVYICTPYLVPDYEMINALVRAAKRGVDVRIITPGIPDKKLIYRLTRSYYPVLLKAGVKIYEYAPGFVHAKSIVCDDRITVVGTINMDFRSLYLHFECGVLMTGTGIANTVRDDNLAMMEKCRVVEKGFPKRTLAGRIIDSVLRTFAPMV
jgi:cardiolipin synthase